MTDFLLNGPSRSFPDGFTGDGEGTIMAGNDIGPLLADFDFSRLGSFLALELDTELLGYYTGSDHVPMFEKTVGFARFSVGDEAPGPLVEIVRHEWTDDMAVRAARVEFEKAGFKTAICLDRPGRIVNRLIRPYLNAVLRRFDEGLATESDLDQTMMMGLGYPEGPLSLLKRTGLSRHCDVSQALYEQRGDPDFSPARRARVAKVNGV